MCPNWARKGALLNRERLLTVPEADRYRKLCNFTPQERQVFDLRVGDKSVVEIALALNLSERTVARRVNGIRAKMNRV